MGDPHPLASGFAILSASDYLEACFATRCPNAAVLAEEQRVCALVLSDTKRFGYYAGLLAVAVRRMHGSNERAARALHTVHPLESLKDLLAASG